MRILTHDPKLLWIFTFGVWICFCLAQWPFVSHVYSYDFDEGVYWQTLSLLKANFKLYSEIYYSQWPMFVKSLDLLQSLAGSGIHSARLGVVLLSSLLIFALAVLSQRLKLGLWSFALIAWGAIDSKFFHLAHQLKGDAPAIALFFVSVAFLWPKENQKSISIKDLTISAIAFILALQMK